MSKPRKSIARRVSHRLGTYLLARAGTAAPKALEQLPGTPYARYAVPTEYLPSRDYKGRWGAGGHPPIGWLMDRFRKHRPAFAAFVREMSDVSRQFADVAEQFDEAMLPMPAWYGVPYAPFDAVALCTMIRKHRPRLFVEIGSGISTCWARLAIERFNLSTKIVSIDPEPRTSVDAICDEVIRDSLESCDMAIFDRLQPNDILFVDGSHRSFQNSDVTVFFGDVLPRVRPGTIVHVHDVNLPYDYADWALNWYWNEQFLLMALFLGAGDKILPLAPTCYICRDDDLIAGFTPGVALQETSGWRGGGAMWFTLTEPLA